MKISSPVPHCLNVIYSGVNFIALQAIYDRVTVCSANNGTLIIHMF